MKKIIWIFAIFLAIIGGVTAQVLFNPNNYSAETLSIDKELFNEDHPLCMNQEHAQKYSDALAESDLKYKEEWIDIIDKMCINKEKRDEEFYALYEHITDKDIRPEITPEL